ncbi:MAG TPA: DUF6524 family protein [Gemmatimonadales bacterium]|jgi:hypothetical protein
METERLTPGVLIVRFLTALLLVYATFNPEGFSFFHWVAAPLIFGSGIHSLGPLKVVAGILLVMSWLVFLHATRRSLGVVRTVLLLALTCEILLILIDWNLVGSQTARAVTHLALVGVSLGLTLGLSWFPVMQWFTGRPDPDRAV